MQGRNEE
jgi:hypothetical protein